MDVKIKSQGVHKDITGGEMEFFMVGAINKAGHKRISKMVPSCELDRVTKEFRDFANSKELPPTLANIRF